MRNPFKRIRELESRLDELTTRVLLHHEVLEEPEVITWTSHSGRPGETRPSTITDIIESEIDDALDDPVKDIISQEELNDALSELESELRGEIAEVREEIPDTED